MPLLYAYNFDEASGNILDQSGNGRDVVYSGNLARTASAAGHTDKGMSQSSTAIDSNGPSITGLQTTSYTVMAWVKRTTNALDGWIAELKASGSGDRGILFLSGAVQSRVRNAAGTVGNVSTTQPTAGTWYHVAGSYSTTDGKIHLYINGAEIGTGATLAGPLKSTSTSSHLLDALGSETIIDDLRYYDTALDAATITTLMSTPVAAGASFSGTVTLSGSGSITGSGSPAVSRPVALSGNGTVAPAGAPAVARTATLSGAGAATAVGTPGATGAASLTGSGGATTAAVAGAGGTTNLAGAGTLSATGTPGAAGTLGLTGAGTLAGAGSPGHRGAASLAGSGSLTPAGQPALPGDLSLSGGGLLAGSHGDDFAGSIPLSGVGALSLAGAVEARGTLALTGAGTLDALGQPAFARQLALTGAGAIEGEGQPATRGALVLAGIGALAFSDGAVPRPGRLTATATDSLAARVTSSTLTTSNEPASRLEARDGV